MTPSRPPPRAGPSGAPRGPLAEGALPGEPLAPATLDGILRDLLAASPSTLVLALDATATRVPLPADERLVACAALPGEQPTLIDLVVAEDREAVLGCWERARTVGLGRARVRLAHWPGQVVTFTVVDSRHRHGVWIGLLVPDGGWGPAATGLDPALLAPDRPRTAVLCKDLFGVIVDADERTTRMLGWPAEELVGTPALDLVHPDDRERAVGQWLEMRARRLTQRVRLRHRHRDGHWVWVEVENTYVGPDDPDGVLAVGRMTDISDEMAAVEALRRQEERFRRLTESLPVGVFEIVAGGGPGHRIGYANARVAAMLGVAGAATLDQQIALVDPAHRVLLGEAVGRALAGGADQQVEVEVHGHADRRRYLFTVAALPGEEGPPGRAGRLGAIVSVTDITDGARLREELRIQATYDLLTGCLNRAAVLAELEGAVAGPGVERLAVLFVDLDRFKAVNDTHGHAVGDALLAVVARRLIGRARDGDRIGRIGGDEFLLVCPDVADRADALALAGRVHDHLRGTFRVAGIRLALAASVGVAMGHPGATADELVARSDDAMYRAKRTGAGLVLHAGV